jgi:hypothetical protein
VDEEVNERSMLSVNNWHVDARGEEELRTISRRRNNQGEVVGIADE